MVVQHNLRAMNANRMLGITTGTLSKSSEKLSSGYKINRAADDAAGLAISEKMRKQMRGLTQASANAEDGISAVQTAEGALTEVHDMLQRMNELAVKAANGTNALSDRQTIQDEVDQLLTEIDRVAETTKFNEIYLLKGDADRVTKYLEAKDAGLKGALSESATKASFTMDALKLGDSITIAGKEYRIGAAGTDADPEAGVTAIRNAITASITNGANATYPGDNTADANAMAGAYIDLDGIQYTVVTDESQINTDKNMLTLSKIMDKVAVGSTVKYNGNVYRAMVDEVMTNKAAGKDGIDDEDASFITDVQAYKMIRQELGLANNVGANKENSEVDVNVTFKDKNGTDVGGPTDITEATLVTGGFTLPAGAAKVVFAFDKGVYTAQESLYFSIHAGADADMNNKIGIQIDALDTKGLGIDGLNVKDTTSAAATYAIDSIAEAIAHVSKQRSMIGAIQNRLEHTINNLDNIVENTTAAESTIRDTDMATEMVKYSNANILQQAGQSMLAQSNQANQGVLSLLQ
ncbi:MAG: flagellar hook protein [Lachnospiraceae bacterium]|nr:flagellar hook protein [Lachnospiraceae bacterium]